MNGNVHDSKSVRRGEGILSYSRDTLYMGYGTYPIAWRNRSARAIIVPDCYLSVSLGPITANVDRILLRQTSDKVWPVVPVDSFTPELLDCDRPTLLPYAQPVFERWAKHLLRRYALAYPSDIRKIDNEWEWFIEIHTRLAIRFPDKWVAERAKRIAAKRLVNA